MSKACADCGRTIPITGPPRCPAHFRPRPSAFQRGYTPAYTELRRQVLEEEDVCWICGEAGQATDALTADHVQPLSRGGQNVRENLRAAHSSCNKSRKAGGRGVAFFLTRPLGLLHKSRRGTFTQGSVQIVVYRDRNELRKELDRRGWSQGELARHC